MSATTAPAAADDRILIRVLIASSIELRAEREALDSLIETELAARPDLERIYRFECLRWEEDAASVGGERINLQIDRSLDLEDVDFVIAVVWRRIGSGTREEIERALARDRAVGRPALLVYRRRAPCPGEPEERARWQEVENYCSELVDRAQIVSEVDDGADLVERVRRQLPKLLPSPSHAGEPAKPEAARRGFLALGSAAVALSFATLVLTRTISFPDRGVGFWPVLLILLAPPVLAALALSARWAFGRLLDSFVATWFSPDYRNEELYRAFDWFVPARVLPERVLRPLAKSLTADIGRWSLVALLLLAPVAGQWSALFDEILLWDLVVGTEVVLSEGGDGAAEGRTCGDEPKGNRESVESCYVDRRPSGRFPLGLQDSRARGHYESLRDRLVLVYARGKFERSEGLSSGEKRLANLGPQVFPPWQPGIYLALLALSAGAQLHGLWRLGRLARELRPRRAPAERVAADSALGA